MKTWKKQAEGKMDSEAPEPNDVSYSTNIIHR